MREEREESEEKEDKISWIKDNWTSITAWLVAIGVGYGIYATNNKWVDSRISSIEDLQLNEVKFKTSDNSTRIQILEMELKVQHNSISDVKSKIDVINAKLDYITALIKQRGID